MAPQRKPAMPNAIALFLHAYGAEIDRVNEGIKANSMQQERDI
jgi:hypothetical protein